MEAEKFSLYTPEEYLEAEKHSVDKHEYLAGTIHAMAGTSKNHGRITREIESRMNGQFRDGSCEAFTTDLKVWIENSSQFYYYPDVVVTCDPSEDDEYVIKYPSIIVEVTSPSTENTDRREKLINYQTLPSLHHYVIVSQSEMLVEWYRRTENSWEFLRLQAPDERLDFPGQGVSLTVSEIYESVSWNDSL